MRRLFFTVITGIIVFNLQAQSPEVFNYQAVIRNNEGQVLSDQAIRMKISILQTNVTGTPVYSEEHSVATNAYGLVTLSIGQVILLTIVSLP